VHKSFEVKASLVKANMLHCRLAYTRYCYYQSCMLNGKIGGAGENHILRG